MLRLSIEEQSALNLVLQFTTVADLLTAAMKGFTDLEEETELSKEKSDLCWKVLKTLKQSRRPCQGRFLDAHTRSIFFQRNLQIYYTKEKASHWRVFFCIIIMVNRAESLRSPQPEKIISHSKPICQQEKCTNFRVKTFPKFVYFFILTNNNNCSIIIIERGKNH